MLFPLVINGKKPIHYNWRTRSYTKEEIEQYRLRGHNIGRRLDASDLVVDFDVKNLDPFDDKEGYVKEFLAEFNLFRTKMVRTASGGIHAYCKKDPSISIKRYVKEKWQNIIEFKTEGTYLVSEGSMIDGEAYVLMNDYEPVVAPAKLVSILKKETPSEFAVIKEVSLDEISRHLDQLDPRQFSDYDDWLKIGQACHSGNQDSLELFINWSRKDPAYNTPDNAEEIRIKWASFSNNGGINVDYLKKCIKDAGGVIPRERAIDVFADVKIELVEEDPDGAWVRKAQEIMDYVEDKDGNFVRFENHIQNCTKALESLARYYGLYWDSFEVAFIVEMKPEWAKDGILSEGSISRLNIILNEKFDTVFSRSTLNDSLLALQACEEFCRNSLTEYVNGLHWDGEERLSYWLCQYGGAPDTPYHRAVSELIYLGMVARALVPGIKFDYMPILESPKQGIGKSLLVASLSPREEWATSISMFKDLSRNKNDVVLAMEKNWVVEVPEIAGITSGSDELAKAFITESKDRLRRPYAKRAETIPRQSILIGTTNAAKYLTDTSNRRYLPVSIKKPIKIKEFKKIREQIIAEARVKFLQFGHHCLWLRGDVEEIARRKQDERRYRSFLEEKLEAAIDELGKPFKMASAELKSRLVANAGGSLTMSKVTDSDIIGLMDYFGYEYKVNLQWKGKRVRGWKKKTDLSQVFFDIK